MFFHGSCVSLSIAVASTSSSESGVERPTAIRLLVAGANPARHFILIAADPVVGAGACDSRAANDEACSGLISRAGSRGEFDSRPPLYGSTPPFFPALVGRRGFN